MVRADRAHELDLGAAVALRLDVRRDRLVGDDLVGDRVVLEDRDGDDARDVNRAEHRVVQRRAEEAALDVALRDRVVLELKAGREEARDVDVREEVGELGVARRARDLESARAVLGEDRLVVAVELRVGVGEADERADGEVALVAASEDPSQRGFERARDER